MKLSKSCTHVFSICLYVKNSSFLNKRWKKIMQKSVQDLTIPNEYANELKIMKDCTIHCKYTNRIENNLCWYNK